MGVLTSITTLGWIASAMAVSHIQRSTRAQKEALQAAADKTDMELRFVRQQVNSHLVFNALNSIMTAIEEKSPLASAMVMDLSRLLRQSLETLPHMGTLGEEVDRVRVCICALKKAAMKTNWRLRLI